jgi:hypothetical protein
MSKVGIPAARFVCSLAIALSYLFLCGCQPREEVSTQRVPKEQSGYLLHRRNPVNLTPGVAETSRTLQPEEITDRMLVAVYPLETAMWFFKVNGKIEQFTSIESELIKFFETVEFTDGSPKWDLPSDWVAGEARPMRFATLRIGKVEPPLEMAISNLPVPQDMLQNINRWRGQMNLSPIKQDELRTVTKPLKSEIDNAILFDVNGKMGAGPAMASMAGLSGSPRAQSPPAESRSDVQAKQPEGWVPGTTSDMVPIRYQKIVSGDSAQISVIPLPAAANTWEPNVTRWAGEVDLLDLKPDELTQLTSKVEIDGVSGNLVRLVPDDHQNPKATIGVMVKKKDVAWFVKLTGARKLVIESETLFAEFLKSIKLPASR